MPIFSFARNPRNVPTLIILGAISVFTYLFILEVIGRSDLKREVFIQPKLKKLADLQSQATALKTDLESKFNRMAAVEEEVVNIIYENHQHVHRDILAKKLDHLFSKNDWLYGLGYALDAPPSSHDHYALYYYRLHSIPQLKDIADSYNYLESDWYKKLMRGKRWLPPFYGTVASVKLIERGRPLRLEDGASPFGVSYVGVKADDINKSINETLDLGLNGFSYMFEKVEDQLKPVFWPKGGNGLKKDSSDSFKKVQNLIISELWDEKDSVNNIDHFSISIENQSFLWSKATIENTRWKVFLFYSVDDVEINKNRWVYSHWRMLIYFLIAAFLIFQLLHERSKFGLVQGFKTAFFATIPILILQLFYFIDLKSKGYSAEKESIIKQTEQATRQIEERLDVLEYITKEIKDSINYGRIAVPLDRKKIEATLKQIFQSHPEIFGLGLCWDPGRSLPKDQLYAPFIFRPQNSKKDFVLTQLNRVSEENKQEFDLKPYDYTVEIKDKTKWYHRIKRGDTLWQKPYYGQIARTILTEYGEPIFASKEDEQNGKPLGIIYADYSLKQVKKIVESLRIGRTGYSYIVSDNDLTLIYTPEEGYTEREDLETLHNRFDQRKNDKSLEEFIKFLSDKKHHKVENDVHLEYTDAISGVKKWRVYSKFADRNWTLVTIFPLDQLDVDSNIIRQESIKGIIWLIVSLCFLVTWLSRRTRQQEQATDSSYLRSSISQRRWRLSNQLALIFLFGTILTWVSAYYFNDGFISSNDDEIDDFYAHGQGATNNFVSRKPLKITNKLTSDLYLNRIDYLDDFTKLPTALNVETLEFLDANDIRLSGEIWQYLNSNMIDIENPIPQLRFKNVLDSKFTLDNNQTQKGEDNPSGKTLYKWYFTVSIRQDFDYSKYPFDSKALTIRLGPRDMTHKFVLVPHFASYQLNSNYEPNTSPRSKPGLSAYLNLTDWSISESFFNYDEPILKSNFGLDENSLKTNKVELNYSIIIKRNFIGPFIGDLLPFIVISIFLFALFKGMKDKADTNKGVRTEIVDTAAALFFSLLVSHFKLRDLLEFNKVVYVETFYFILYFAIVLFLINRMLYRSQKYKFINENDNENIKMSYWPLISASVLVVAILTFI